MLHYITTFVNFQFEQRRIVSKVDNPFILFYGHHILASLIFESKIHAIAHSRKNCCAFFYRATF